jgi:hypothetical protein
MAKAMARPSLVLVPRPSSSIMTLICSQHSCHTNPRDTIVQATPVDVAQNESNLSHLSSKCGYIGLYVIVHTQSRKKLVQNRERSIIRGNTTKD